MMKAKSNTVCNFSITEEVSGEAVGRPKVIVRHVMNASHNEEFEGVWSHEVVVPFGQMVDLDLTALTYSQRVAPEDLFTDQAVGLMRIRNVSQGVVTISFSMESGDILMSDTWRPGRDAWYRVPEGNLLAQPFKTIRLQSLPIGSTDDAKIEIILASRKVSG